MPVLYLFHGASKPAYRIHPQKGSHPSFSLEREGKEVARLEFENGHGSSVKAKIGSGVYSISRKKGLTKDLHIQDEERQVHLGEFVANLLSRGTLSIAGKKYSWRPVNKTWTAWAWFDESGSEMLRINRKFHLIETRGEVHAKDALYHEVEMLLALLGWHLLLLGYQNSLEHLFSLIDARRMRKSAKHA